MAYGNLSAVTIDNTITTTPKLNFTLISGPAGVNGSNGSKGDKGDIGAKGDKGDAGASGADIASLILSGVATEISKAGFVINGIAISGLSAAIAFLQDEVYVLQHVTTGQTY